MRKIEAAPDEATAFLNARLIDPASGKDEPGGLLVKDGIIADLGGHLRRNAPERAHVVDCKGHVLCPGLVDMRVFTGEPGQEHRETLKTASPAMKDKVFSNISARAREILQEDMSTMGPVRLKDVEKAQVNVVAVVRRLESEQKITLGKGGDDVVL